MGRQYASFSTPSNLIERLLTKMKRHLSRISTTNYFNANVRNVAIRMESVGFSLIMTGTVSYNAKKVVAHKTLQI